MLKLVERSETKSAKRQKNLKIWLYDAKLRVALFRSASRFLVPLRSNILSEIKVDNLLVIFPNRVNYLTMALFQISNCEFSFLAKRRAQKSSAFVKNRFINNIIFRRSSHAKHKRVPIRFRPDINSSSVRETLNPRVMSVIHKFENVAFEHARNISPEASVSDCI